MAGCRCMAGVPLRNFPTIYVAPGDQRPLFTQPLFVHTCVVFLTRVALTPYTQHTQHQLSQHAQCPCYSRSHSHSQSRAGHGAQFYSAADIADIQHATQAPRPAPAPRQPAPNQPRPSLSGLNEGALLRRRLRRRPHDCLPQHPLPRRVHLLFLPRLHHRAPPPQLCGLPHAPPVRQVPRHPSQPPHGPLRSPQPLQKHPCDRVDPEQGDHSLQEE